MSRFTRIERLSTWRRIALHAWGTPKDPSVYGTLDIDATEALALVADVRARTGIKVTLTHLVGVAIARAIRKRPEVNSIVRLGTLWKRDTIDVFFQVAFEGGENLAGHKVDRADEKTLVDMARALGEGASRVRKGEAESTKSTKKLSKLPPQLLGMLMHASSWVSYELGLDLSRVGIPFDGFGSAMITSVGSFGLTNGFAPLVSFSRCPILVLVGEVQPRPVVRDGAVVARPILPLGVTFDHRVLDGYQAGVLAREVRTLLERPRDFVEEHAANPAV